MQKLITGVDVVMLQRYLIIFACVVRRKNNYYVSNYFKRNKQIAEYSNILIAFIKDGVESRGTMNTVGYAKKLKKMVKIIN